MAMRAATTAMAARAAPRGMRRLFSTTSPNSFMSPPITAVGKGEGIAARAAPRRLFSTTSANTFMSPPITAMGNGEGTPGREQAPPSTNLFVSGLNKRTPVEKLREAFSQFGQVVDAKVVTDRVSGYSKGFGFVRYATIEEAEKGREGMDGKFLDGWVIFAEFARPRPERPPPQNNMTNSNGYNSYGRE